MSDSEQWPDFTEDIQKEENVLEDKKDCDTELMEASLPDVKDIQRLCYALPTPCGCSSVLHRGENRYPCPRCGKVYQWKSNLGRHMRSHKARDSGELHCSPCGKLFASVATYRQHLAVSRRHVPENEFR
ncbi:PREDICTED: zinc finger protein 728-like [Papilio polytes]|uniref:zinc finger protein 728-like n=1 Tax=Papilio polytes TaxID=76194 RepID=UPI0006764D41|nr:PREDICTED: zinc finger protein 728-like [Papilio polytes]